MTLGPGRLGDPGSARALAAEVVLEADDVVELRGRDLDQRAALDRRVAMPSADPDPGAIARSELAIRDRAGGVLERQAEPSLKDVDPLVLRRVVLERQALARLDDEELPDVPVRMRPDELMAPGLLDAPRQRVLGRRRDRIGGAHRGPAATQPRTSCSPTRRSSSRSSAEVASV